MTRNRIISTIILLAGLLTIKNGTAEIIVRPEHPRIYITRETIPEIRRRCREEYKSFYQDLQSTRWILDRQPSVGYSDVTNMIMPAFLYIVEGDSQYADKTKAYLDALSQNPPRNQYLTPEYIRQAAACYDWIFDRLSAEEKSRYARTLIDMGDYMLTLWRHSDFNNHFVNETLSIIYIGVVLHGDGIDDRAAKRFLNAGSDYLKNHAIPAANEIAADDGGQAEGFSYNDWGYARPLALTAEMWRAATGEDLISGSDFFKTQALWHLYCLRPHDNTFVKAEDCPSGFQPGANLKSFIHLIGSRCQDGHAQWLGDRITRRYKQQSWKEILWRDPNLKALSPDALPLARHFNKLGWVVSRSGWNSPDDTFSLFQCGDFFAGHQHLDANTFVIHKGSSLAIDSGVNEYSSHRANYYCRTIAHNGITVFDPGERFSSAVWSAQGSGGVNDGGQLRGSINDRAGQFETGGPHDIADITRFVSTPQFTYICGDATRAYNPDKMQWFTRQFVHIQPDLFVVFDRVVSRDESYRKTWLLHSIEKPVRDENRFTIKHGRGTLVSHTILPAAFDARLTGGPAKEYWVDGKNYPPDSKSDPEAGAWRIEISPAEPNRSDLFLHVLQAGLADGFEAAKVSIISEDSRKGVFIQHENLAARLLFGVEGPPVCSIVLERDGIQIEEKTMGKDQAYISKPELIK